METPEISLEFLKKISAQIFTFGGKRV